MAVASLRELAGREDQSVGSAACEALGADRHMIRNSWLDVVKLKECIVVRHDRANIPLRGSGESSASAGYDGAAHVGYSSIDTSRLWLRRN